MFASKSVRSWFLVVVLFVAFALTSTACDTGGTFYPDAGCLGEGSSFDSCVQALKDSGAEISAFIGGEDSQQTCFLVTYRDGRQETICQ